LAPRADFSYIFFRGKFRGNFHGKFSTKNVGKKMEFSAEKVLKNYFSKKFHGILCGKSFSAEKNVRKIGPRLYP
jgi:hypothetical protein